MRTEFRLTILLGDEGWPELRILLRQVEHGFEFIAAGTGPELFELLAGIPHQVAPDEKSQASMAQFGTETKYASLWDEPAVAPFPKSEVLL
jgi:hypothetical protein